MGEVLSESNRPSRSRHIYIYLRDEQALRSLAAPFRDEQTFFAYLETLDLSDLVRTIRIWVAREGASEGLGRLNPGSRERDGCGNIGYSGDEHVRVTRGS